VKAPLPRSALVSSTSFAAFLPGMVDFLPRRQVFPRLSGQLDSEGAEKVPPKSKNFLVKSKKILGPWSAHPTGGTGGTGL
jgi:hypothetical protein